MIFFPMSDKLIFITDIKLISDLIFEFKNHEPILKITDISVEKIMKLGMFFS